MTEAPSVRAATMNDADSITDATRLYTRCGMNQYNVFVEVSKMIRDGEELANLGEKVT